MKTIRIPSNIKILAFFTLLAVGAAAFPGAAHAYRVFQYAPGQEMIGKPRAYVVEPNDDLLDLAIKTDIGYNAIVDANPGVDPWLPDEGRTIAIPVAWILPDAPRDGIVLNLAEMRLFYFYEIDGLEMVATYPIGVGQRGWNTPLGTYKVTGKEANPAWYPPESIRLEKPELPDEVAPGPDNPLGEYAIRMNLPGYLIHGTNNPYGVGRMASHGCMRLYPEDIKHLFQRVDRGTPVHIVYQPVKVALVSGRLFVEVHKDYLGGTDLRGEALSGIDEKGLGQLLDMEKLDKALNDKSGIPTDVTWDPTDTAE